MPPALHWWSTGHCRCKQCERAQPACPALHQYGFNMERLQALGAWRGWRRGRGGGAGAMICELGPGQRIGQVCNCFYLLKFCFNVSVFPPTGGRSSQWWASSWAMPIAFPHNEILLHCNIKFDNSLVVFWSSSRKRGRGGSARDALSEILSTRFDYLSAHECNTYCKCLLLCSETLYISRSKYYPSAMTFILLFCSEHVRGSEIIYCSKACIQQFEELLLS